MTTRIGQNVVLQKKWKEAPDEQDLYGRHGRGCLIVADKGSEGLLAVNSRSRVLPTVW
jgi:hypothetical protein